MVHEDIWNRMIESFWRLEKRWKKKNTFHASNYLSSMNAGRDTTKPGRAHTVDPEANKANSPPLMSISGSANSLWQWQIQLFPQIRRTQLQPE